MGETTEKMDAAATAEVDETLYSRQLYVMGHEAQRRMMASSALVIGLGGLGVEVSKNCILAGLSSITLCDPLPPTYYDLGAQFYLTSEHVEKKEKGRAELCRDSLAELNPYVQVNVATSVNTLSSSTIIPLLPGITVCVVTIPMPKDDIIKLNLACREQGVRFIYSQTSSVFGMIFCDFGTSFTVQDKDGEPAATSQIESVLTDTIKVKNDAGEEESKSVLMVKVLEDQGRHGLESGDMVSFSRLQGVGSVVDGTPYKVQVTGPFTFYLTDVTPAETKDGGDKKVAVNQQGYITQIKQPVTMSFESLETAYENPGDFMLSDFSKFDRPIVLHLGFQAATQYWQENNQTWPTPGDVTAAQTVVEKAKALDTNKAVVDDEAALEKASRIWMHMASGSCAVLSPMCAALGGMVGQEVLKAVSGKFTPIKGFFYLDADECLPDKLQDPALLAPTNTRYDSQIAVFGKDIQQKLLELRYFIIGAGAIGCEMIKNWAMMGVGCDKDKKGHVYVTDMDRIERSNLSRQFLFRNTDIDKFKSAAAAGAAQRMNSDMNMTAYQEKVAADTEHLFGDDFYDKLSGVCTALDNVEARLYVDQRCLFYRLPMLESGTLGTKGNTQVVVPHLTENYGATRDPPEKSIPVCTLKNFPNQIQHTLQWARDWFEGAFKKTAEEVNSYLSTAPDVYMQSLEANTKVETLKMVRQALVEERPVVFEDCITWARLTFERLFDNQIKQLLFNFPPDQVTSSGTKFWSGSKRCPKVLEFNMDSIDSDSNMRVHLEFVVTAANLRAEMYGIKGRTDEEFFKQVMKDVIVPDFVPSDGVKIAKTDAEEEQNNSAAPMDTTDSEAEEIFNTLPKPSELAGFRLQAIDFDKDVDDHARFITACSNGRAMNYSIPTEDVHRSRAIAGRIIPAIATTTALVTGLICLELYKIIGTPRKELKIDAYKNGFLNLAIPFMTLSEPNAPAKTKAKLKGEEWNWTPWDSLDMNKGDITMGDFMTYFEKEYNLEISMLSHGASILYSFFANKKKVEERKAMKMSEVITSITKKEFPPNQLFIILEVIANDMETDEEVEIPYIKFRFR